MTRPAPRPPELPEIVVIDTETTGFGPGARLVEIAAVHARGGAVVREFQTLVDPRMRIPAGAMSVHGITDAMVRGAPRAEAALDALLGFVGALPVAAHNAAFDRGILRNEFARTGVAAPESALYCTCRLARRAYPDAPNHRLATLAQHLRLSAPSHRALADAHTALGLLHACLARSGKGLDELHGPAQRF